MARRCVICAKGTETGSKVSHSNRKTRRTWAPNVQKVKVLLKGSPTRAYVCTKCLKAGRVVRAV